MALRWLLLDLTNEKSTLVQIMAWCWPATSHYLSPMLTQICHHIASLGHNEVMLYTLNYLEVLLRKHVFFPFHDIGPIHMVWSTPNKNHILGFTYDLEEFLHAIFLIIACNMFGPFTWSVYILCLLMNPGDARNPGFSRYDIDIVQHTKG